MVITISLLLSIYDLFSVRNLRHMSVDTPDGLDLPKSLVIPSCNIRIGKTLGHGIKNRYILTHFKSFSTINTLIILQYKKVRILHYLILTVFQVNLELCTRDK